MAIRPSLSLIGLIACSLAACRPAEQVVAEAVVEDPFRLLADVAPIAQQLNFTIDPDQTHYSGMTTITLQVANKTSEFRLHAKDMSIESLSLSGDAGIIETTHAAGEHDLLVVSSLSALSAGTYELSIAFSNDFNNDGVGINRTEQEGRYYIFSQFEAIDARQAFPCFDEPGFKIPWQVTMTVPAGITAISNTPEASVSEQEGEKTIVFEATPPLPSYLIAVAVGPFETVPIDGMSIPGRVVVPYGKSSLAAAAVETTPPLLAYLEDYFGEPYPFKKLDLIATNQAFSGAMEHPGAITYSDFFLLLDETASPRQKSTLIKITAHELAHQWFGNLVTMQWWDDLWLNESFADWMGDKTMDAVYPDFSAKLPELRTLFSIMDVDARPTTKPIRHDFKSTDDFGDGIFLSYYKGKAVIDMFENAVGADVFRDGVVRYLRKFSRQNARAGDLWAEINAGTEFDLAGGLAGFIDRPGIPLVSFAAAGQGRYEVTQARLLTGSGAADQDQAWTIPLVYKYKADDEIITAETILSENTTVLDLGVDVDWILPNANQQGYYRWRVPDDMLVRLGEDAASTLNVRERMGMLTNLWALLSTDKVDGGNFLAALGGIASDTDPSVISALLDQLNNVRQTFVTPELRPLFAAYVRAVLNPTLERIGNEPLSGESAELSTLRPQVLLWLSDYGRDEHARTVTADYTQRFLAGDVPPSEVVNAAMRSEARRGDRDLFEAYVAGFEAAETPNDRRRYVQAIGSFRDPEIVETVLDYVLTGSLQPNEVTVIVSRIAAWPDNNAMLLEWLMQHDTELRDRLPAGTMGRIPDRLTLCDPENLTTIIEFYGAPERIVPGIEGELKDVEAEVMECWEFRQREIGSVSGYLQSLNR